MPRNRLPRHDCVMNLCCAIARHERNRAANVFLNILAHHSFRQSGWRVQLPQDSGQLVDLATFDCALSVGTPCCQLSYLLPNTCTPTRLNTTQPGHHNSNKHKHCKTQTSIFSRVHQNGHCRFTRAAQAMLRVKTVASLCRLATGVGPPYLGLVPRSAIPPSKKLTRPNSKRPKWQSRLEQGTTRSAGMINSGTKRMAYDQPSARAYWTLKERRSDRMQTARRSPARRLAPQISSGTRRTSKYDRRGLWFW